MATTNVFKILNRLDTRPLLRSLSDDGRYWSITGSNRAHKAMGGLVQEHEYHKELAIVASGSVVGIRDEASVHLMDVHVF